MDRRSYRQFCGIASALDIVGERWTLLIVRNLLLGPLRYSEILHGLPGITTNLLAKRLREMEAHGLVERTRSSATDSASAYRLTELGAGLEPALHALGKWGWNWMTEPRPDDMRSLEFVLVAIRRRYKGGTTMRVELVVDDVPYRITLLPTAAETARGAETRPDLRIRASARDAAKLFLDPPRAGVVPSGVEVVGTRERFAEFLGAFTTQAHPFHWPVARRGAKKR